MKQIRRKFDKMLFEGQGKQFLWLFMIIIVVLLNLQIIGALISEMRWQDVLALFMDPGNFGNRKGDDSFRIIVALLGAVLFSALLISVLTNIFNNISESYKKGDSKYSFSNHILIIGASQPLKNMLRAISENHALAKNDILIMTASDVETIRENMKLHFGNTSFGKRISYFHRDRHTLQYLKDACADKACAIYVIGEDSEGGHDALNMRCLSLLKEVCHGEGQIIPCYLIMETNLAFNVFNYSKANHISRLNVEVINQTDYAIERLFTKTDYLPVLSKNDIRKRARIIIVGKSEASASFATLAAQMCHYPNFESSENRTIITLIGYNRDDFEEFVSYYRNLLEMCHYHFISSDKAENFTPRQEYGDFIDIEWEFIEEKLQSSFVSRLLDKWSEDKDEKTVVALCYEDDETNAYAALHLPRTLYERDLKIAVRQNEFTDLISEASSTGMYGRIYIYGNSSDDGSDSLYLYRTDLGKRVNRVYDLEYGNPPEENEDEAWRKLPYSHKASSIASANSIPIKLRCFNIESTPECIKNLSPEVVESLSEVEHRRWMVSQLLMGYRAATIEERKDRKRFKELKNEKFIHLDIAPYSEIADEVNKDINIINNIPYIMTGIR